MWKRILYIKQRVEPKYDTIPESNYPVPLNMAPVQGLKGLEDLRQHDALPIIASW